MHRRTLVLMVILLCLCAQFVFAQDSGNLAAILDQHATAAGLPMGDGKISPAEQNLANALTHAADSFNNTVTDFAQASPKNGAWMNKVDAATQAYNEQLAAAQANIESQVAAANQYANDLATLQSQAPAGDVAQSIVNSLGTKTSTDPLTASASDAYGTQVMNAVYADSAQKASTVQDAFANYSSAQTGDASAQPIANAFNEYARENAALSGSDNKPLSASDQFILNGAMSEIDDYFKSDPLKPNANTSLDKGQQTIVDMAMAAVDEYFEKYEGKHKETVKRHIKHLIEIMVPSANLPINGKWRIVPYTTTTSGQCINAWGDNDGPGDSNPNDNPGEPLCGYANAPSLPFIRWQGGIHPYMLGTSSMYGQEPMRSTYSVKNSQGQTTRSVKVSTFTEYEVLSPTQIRVHTFMQEEGGCSINANYIIELVTADDSVCPNYGQLPLPEPTPVVEPPEGTSGPYNMAQPLVMDETQCNDTNAIPTIDEINLTKKSDGTIKLDYGGDTQTLFSNGTGYYDYDSGSGGKTREQISVSFNDDLKSGMLSWSVRDGQGAYCSATMDFALPGSANDPSQKPADSTNTDSSTDGNSGTDSSSAGLTITPGDYTVTWQTVPGAQCPDALKAQMPNFAKATISTDGSGFTLEGAGTQYALANQSGQYMYTAPNDDGSMTYMGIYGSDPNGHLSGIFSRTTSDGATCVSTMDLAPA